MLAQVYELFFTIITSVRNWFLKFEIGYESVLGYNCLMRGTLIIVRKVDVNRRSNDTVILIINVDHEYFVRRKVCTIRICNLCNLCLSCCVLDQQMIYMSSTFICKRLTKDINKTTNVPTGNVQNRSLPNN